MIVLLLAGIDTESQGSPSLTCYTLCVQIKLLQMVNQADPDDVKGIVRLRNFFYWREHLVLATELLHLNLYQCARRATSASDRYFTLDRVREIAAQVPNTPHLPYYISPACDSGWLVV